MSIEDIETDELLPGHTAREVAREAEARERAAGFAILATVALLVVLAMGAVAWGLSQ